MSVDALVPQVRSALGVSSSYDDEKIPDLIRRKITRLLRDYHFPKSVKRTEFLNLAEGDQFLTLPEGFKKELEVRIYNPSDNSYTDPLRKREQFRLPYPSNAPFYYWLEGTKLWLDTPIDASRAGFTAIVWHESMDAASNEDWLTTDFPDAVLYLSAVSGAAEFRKPEVAQIYAALWQDEQASLAIYLNELEWGGVEMYMREAGGPPLERYPIG